MKAFVFMNSESMLFKVASLAEILGTTFDKTFEGLVIFVLSHVVHEVVPFLEDHFT